MSQHDNKQKLFGNFSWFSVHQIFFTGGTFASSLLPTNKGHNKLKPNVCARPFVNWISYSNKRKTQNATQIARRSDMYLIFLFVFAYLNWVGGETAQTQVKCLVIFSRSTSHVACHPRLHDMQRASLSGQFQEHRLRQTYIACKVSSRDCLAFFQFGAWRQVSNVWLRSHPFIPWSGRKFCFY